MRIKLIAAILIAWLAPTGSARAQDIQVITPGSVQEALKVLGADFTKETGTKVTLSVGSGGSTLEKLKGPGSVDVVVLGMDVLEEMGKSGLLKPETIMPIGTVAVGLAVRAGAPVPDISTPAKLRATLLAASSVSYMNPASGSTSGAQTAQILAKLGIADEVAKKTKFVGAKGVANGEADLHMQPVSELMPVEGITIVGPLPQELGGTTTLGAAVATKSAAPEKSLAYVRYLARPESQATYKAKGVLPAKKGGTNQ